MFRSPFFSTLAVLVVRTRDARCLFLCTPVVWIGGPAVKLAKPPRISVRLLNAVKLWSAFNAPGFVNNWANGIADAKGLFKVLVVMVLVLVVLVVLVVVDEHDDDEDGDVVDEVVGLPPFAFGVV